MSTTYRVTKHFTSGNLAGMVLVDETMVEFQVGEKIPQGPTTPSGYTVIAVESVEEA